MIETIYNEVFLEDVPRPTELRFETREALITSKRRDREVYSVDGRHTSRAVCRVHNVVSGPGSDVVQYVSDLRGAGYRVMVMAKKALELDHIQFELRIFEKKNG